MQRLTFIPGKKILVTGKQYTVTGILNDTHVQIKSDDGIEKKLELSTLFDWYLSGNLKTVRQKEKELEKYRSAVEAKKINKIENYSEKSKAKALKIRNFLIQLEDEGIKLNDECEITKKRIEAIAKKVGLETPAIRTIFRWKAKAAYGKDLESLMPRWGKSGGKGRSRVDDVVDECFREAVDSIYLTTEKRTISDLYWSICTNLNKINAVRPQGAQIKIPARATLERWIKINYEGHEICAKRTSKKYADYKYRKSMKNPEAWGFMECAEVDHSPLDVMVIDEETGLVLGRPRLSIMIEWKTRCVLGLSIGFESTSTQTVLDCVKFGILQKESISQAYPDLNNDWPCWGMPKNIKLDNGPEFHSAAFNEVMKDLLINPIYCPRGEAWWKGRVEAFIKKANLGFVANLPGATLTQLMLRTTKHDPSLFAVLDIKVLREIIYRWVVDVYNQDYMKSIRSTPYNAWKREFDLTKISLPNDIDLFHILCSLKNEKTLQHYGIEMLGQRSFNNKELSELRRRKQHDKTVKVKVRYNPEKMDRIWVYDEDHELWIEVLNSNPETSNLSHYQMSLINKMINDEYRASKTNISVFEAKEKIRAIVEKEKGSRKIKERKRALKILGFDKPNEFNNDPNKGISSGLVRNKKLQFDEAKKISSEVGDLPRERLNLERRNENVKRIFVDEVYEGGIEIFPIDRFVTKRGVYGGE